MHQEIGKHKRQQMARGLFNILIKCDDEVLHAFCNALIEHGRSSKVDICLRSPGKQLCIECNFSLEAYKIFIMIKRKLLRPL